MNYETNEDILYKWTNEIQGIIEQRDDFSCHNSTCKLVKVKEKLQKLQSDKVKGYYNAYAMDSKKEVQQIVEQMKDDLETIPELKEKLKQLVYITERYMTNE